MLTYLCGKIFLVMKRGELRMKRKRVKKLLGTLLSLVMIVTMSSVSFAEKGIWLLWKRRSNTY